MEEKVNESLAELLNNDFGIGVSTIDVLLQIIRAATDLVQIEHNEER